MLNPVTVTVTIPKSFQKSFKRLSENTTIAQETLMRLAMYEFLSKHNSYEGESEERDSYSHILGHFVKERKKLFEIPRI